MLSFLPLTLGVGRTSDAGSGGKPPSKSEAERILRRDDFTCRFCGFRAIQYQRIVPTSDGLVTACSFCEQVTLLDRASIVGGGILIWLPEITQVDLNHIARAIYVAQSPDETSMAATASRALDALMIRRVEAKKRLGSDDPMLLATVLHENIKASDHDQVITKLEGIRLMPLDKHMVRSRDGDVNGFPQIVKFWRSAQGPFADLPTDKWKDLFAKIPA